MSGPEPHPETDDETARKTTGPRSRDEQLKTPETEPMSPATGDAPSRAGGELQRDIATKDELEQQVVKPGEKTRVHKGEEQHVEKEPGERDRPGEMRNPDAQHAQRNKGATHR